MTDLCENCKHQVPGESGICVDPAEKDSFFRKIFSAGALRFAGWWSIFAGVLAVNSVCPVCGSTACPVGVGTTGVIAVFFAAVKQWGGLSFKALRSRIVSFTSDGKNFKGNIEMDKTYNASDIQKGYHPDGYRIDKTASPVNFYTKWEITSEKKWINQKPSCFHSMPQEGWYKAESFDEK